MTNRIINVFYADQYRLIRDGFRNALKEYPIEIIGEAENVIEMMEGLGKCKADLLITSHKLNEHYASNFLPVVKEKYPDLKILMRTLRRDRETILHYIEYIDGLLSLASGIDENVQVIKAIVNENKLYYVVNVPTGEPHKSKRVPDGNIQW